MIFTLPVSITVTIDINFQIQLQLNHLMKELLIKKDLVIYRHS